MKKTIILAMSLLAFMPFASQGFPLSFKYIMCTVDESALKEEVYDLEKKWKRTQRRYTRGSRYYKHVKRHMKEATQAIDETMERSDCSAERNALLKQLRNELEDLR